LSVASLTLFLLALPAAAQGPQKPVATLTGHVADDAGSPVAGALVTAQTLASPIPMRVVSDAKGDFTVEIFAAGHFHVIVSKPGYSEGVEELVILVDESPRLEFKLTAGVTEVEDTSAAGNGSRRLATDTPYNETEVSKTQLVREPPVSTSRALDDTGEVSSKGANTLNQATGTRGVSSSDTVTLLDGKRLLTSRAVVPPSVVDVGQVDSVEVLQGAHSSSFGSGAVGGVVNIVTKRPERAERYDLDLQLGGSLATNGMNRRGNADLYFSTAHVALHVGGSLFRQTDYEMGGDAITLAEVLEMGEFYTGIGNPASTYPVGEFPAGATVPNGAGHGFNMQVDFWSYFNDHHSLRYQQLNSHASDLGQPGVAPPLSSVTDTMRDRDLDRYEVTYEADRLNNWFQRLSIGYFGQRLAIDFEELGYAILPGSSWVEVQPPNGNPAQVLTGAPSALELGRVSSNAIEVVSNGIDVSAVFVPHKDMLLTTGYSFLHEDSSDKVSTAVYNPAAPLPTFEVVPDATATNNAFFATLEYNRPKQLRASAGLRLDHWASKADLSTLAPGFPLLDATDSDSTRLTAQIGLVFPLPLGFSPFVRVASSFREPDLRDRYGLYFSAPAGKVAQSIANTLVPEEGFDVQVGVAYQRQGSYVSFTAYRNRILHFISSDLLPYTGGPIAPTPSPKAGPLATSVREGEPVPANAQTTALLYGATTSFSVSHPLGEHGKYGSITPYGYAAYMHGQNQTPLEIQRLLVGAFYEKPSTPVELSGTPDNVPQIAVLPFIGSFGVRYADLKARLNLQYSVRVESKMKRVDPLIFYEGALTNYGTFASLDGITVQSISGSYTFRREAYRAVVSLGIDNLADSLYFDHFTTAAAVGRSFTFGLTLDFHDLLD
jgi:outer membrane receptor protein involved in Fe transport